MYSVQSLYLVVQKILELLEIETNDMLKLSEVSEPTPSSIHKRLLQQSCPPDRGVSSVHPFSALFLCDLVETATAFLQASVVY